MSIEHPMDVASIADYEQIYNEVFVNDDYRLGRLPNIQTVVDIGSNLGMVAMAITKRFPNAQIVCCEPNPTMMQYTKCNTENKLIYEAAAVTNASGVVEFVEAEHNICSHAIGRHPDAANIKTLKKYEVPSATLADILRRNGIDKLDFLKVDAEGAEVEIIESSLEILHQTIIVGESHCPESMARIKQLLSPTHNINGDVLRAVPKSMTFPDFTRNHIWPSKKPLPGVCIVVGADRAQQDILPYWYDNLRKYHPDIPIVFANFGGMSEQWIKWCQQRGKLVDLPGTTGPNKTWFRKPLAIMCGTHEFIIWMDLDCIVQSDISALWKTLRQDQIGIAPDTPQRDRQWPGEGNSGVVTCQHGELLVERWAEVCENPTLHGDQEELYHTLHHHHNLPAEYNIIKGVANWQTAKVLHYAGGMKNEIRRKLGLPNAQGPRAVHSRVRKQLEAAKNKSIIFQKIPFVHQSPHPGKAVHSRVRKQMAAQSFINPFDPKRDAILARQAVGGGCRGCSD